LILLCLQNGIPVNWHTACLKSAGLGRKNLFAFQQIKMTLENTPGAELSACLTVWNQSLFAVLVSAIAKNVKLSCCMLLLKIVCFGQECMMVGLWTLICCCCVSAVWRTSDGTLFVVWQGFHDASLQSGDIRLLMLPEFDQSKMALLPKNDGICPVCSGPDMLGMVDMKCHRYHLQCLAATLSKGRCCAAAGCSSVWGYATFYHLGLQMHYKNFEEVGTKYLTDGEYEDLSEMNLEKIHCLPCQLGIIFLRLHMALLFHCYLLIQVHFGA
jgi:hypothetical protein